MSACIAQRSLANRVSACVASIVFALAAHKAIAQVQPLQHDQAHAIATPQQSSIENVETLLRAEDLLQNNIQFTPASIDVSALKRKIVYPEAALQRNVRGRFELIVYIDKDGSVQSVNFVADRSDDNVMSAIIASACEVVKASKFTPAMLNNQPVSSAVRIPFSLL
ncbi:MAG: energy transducer TonB [Bacteroidota bacterium]|nr:energy transducer TonB [Candidatus Kapabacteria bacterium]MDW8220687.1 energy transducer TonB [Bacteroidota bacterium]